MKLSLNQNSQRHLSLIDFLDFSHKFYGVELRISKIKQFLAIGQKLKDLNEFLEVYNLKPISIFRLNDFSLCSDEKYSEILAKLYKMMEYCYKIGCYLIIVNPSIEKRDIPQWRINRRTVTKLKEISKIAYKEDIKIGFEYLSQPNSSIQNLNQAKKVMDPLKSQDNLGYIIDTFHLIKSREDINNLMDIRDFIFLIQISDLIYEKNISNEDLLAIEDKKRNLPGMGNFDFLNFFKLTKRLRYSEPFSIELIKDKEIDNLYYKILKNLRLSYFDS